MSSYNAPKPMFKLKELAPCGIGAVYYLSRISHEEKENPNIRLERLSFIESLSIFTYFTYQVSTSLSVLVAGISATVKAFVPEIR